MTQASGTYRIFGSELSPYSVKVRSYFRFKGLPHEWIVRSAANEEEFQSLAKLPLVPLVVTPAGEAMQDSTPIIEEMERRVPEPSIHPEDPTLRFLSALIEEYADEWGNKPMFHYRWTYPADLDSAANRLARAMMPGLDEESLKGVVDAVKGRMVPRLALVGSSDATRAPIERSLARQLEILERHLKSRAYLFGGRPSFGDFGLFAQLHQCSTDPTPGALLRERSPAVLAWIERMLSPKVEGPFASWAELSPTLEPLLRQEVAAIFLPWSTANAKALEAGEKEFSLSLNGEPFSQQTQKYHARSLAALRERWKAASDAPGLSAILEKTGSLEWLR